QLILAVAVGPLLCCCTTGKVLASAPSDSPRDPAPVKPTSPCCAHKQSHSKPAHEKKQTPEKPAQPDKKCPCKDGTEKAALTQSDSAQAPLSDFLRTLALDSVVPFGAPAVGEVVTSCP